MSLVITNEKGEYALYKEGKFFGFTKIEIIDSAIVPVKMAPTIHLMKADAKADGVDLTVAVGIRTILKQIQSRKNNIKDKTLIKTLSEEKFMEYIMTASPGLFFPETGKPGFSGHQEGNAVDFNVTKIVNGVPVGTLPSYPWLVKNAIRYGFVRTVPSERWHHTLIPGITDMFFKVKKNHPTWDGLV